MAGFYPDSFIDEVRERSNIVEIISEYLPLQRRGGKHWGLCPFHGEKTASFSVDEQAQLYYCFGCHAGGNVFTFVRDIEKMDFSEALVHLAERARLEIPQTVKGGRPAERRDKTRLYEALTEAARFYHKTLYGKEGTEALGYLHNRGILDGIIRRFGLGATAPGGDSLTVQLLAQGFSKEELIESNLSLERSGRLYDNFRNRVIFPIFDPRGKVIAFGGRVIGDGQPKYLNSGDTPVFNKRRNAYGLNFLRGKRFSRLLLVEGYMDVVSLAQHGIDGCVATLGTALTPEQVRLLKKYESDIVICYDGDEAGQRATQRAIGLFEEAGITPKILVVPGGRDPDEYVRENSAEAFLHLEAIEVTAYRLDALAGSKDLSDEAERAAYAEEAAQILKKLSPVQAERYLKRLSIETGYDSGVLRRQIGVSSASFEPKRHISPVRGQNKVVPVEVLAQRQLIACIAAEGAAAGGVSPNLLRDPVCKAMYEALAIGGMAALHRLMEEESPETRGEMAGILGIEILDAAKTLKESLERIERHEIETEIGEIKQGMSALSKEDLGAALSRIQALTMRLARLKAGRKE
ncbi:MAG: DNA primase [Christensenellaceae bacterium]|jgi:DNA primase|nr:DNA primase [Christensenellaceae bacterium]